MRYNPSNTQSCSARSRKGRVAGGLVAIPLAVGAFLGAGTVAANATPKAASVEAAGWSPTAAASVTAPQVLAVPRTDLSVYVEQLGQAAQREAERLAQEKAEAERIAREEAERHAREEAERIAREEAARRPAVSFPTDGTFTSGFGPRWGTNHNGVDIANAIGTPIRAVTDGTVIESGPASGFGLWVRVQQDDGTIGVYGHIDQSLVRAGQPVRAGEQIATMGNRGQSTGPHLHYEVLQANGTKIDPAPWLAARGIPIPGANRG
ncbi:M23 family metallopeptidase [Rhodococcus sp. CX]|nr:M23 family metallopeptidase [Rhodococcus sp. CX]MBH0123562.1 M23 family metallopeptidase [Rhodococcus sp. CX]